MLKKRELLELRCPECGGTKFTAAVSLRVDECGRIIDDIIARQRIVDLDAPMACTECGYQDISREFLVTVEQNVIIYHRTCHDCGRPTNNYRCGSCRLEFKKKNGVSKTAFDEYEGL